MLGAMCGDIIGSIYEVHNIKSKKFPLFSKSCSFTDDSVMTAAISVASQNYSKSKNYESFREDCIKYMREFGRRHINAGYGGRFINWLISKNPEPYQSYGNGSAMRVSSVAYVADSLEEAETLAEISASVTHNHPDGIAGAKAVAGSIWLLLYGAEKEDIFKYVSEKYYDLNFKLDDIRNDYEFDVSCAGSVPQAINAFLEATGFEDTIRNAISLGGDSDTIAAISGSLAEAYYGIPKNIALETTNFLSSDLLNCVNKFYNINEYSNDSNKKI